MKCHFKILLFTMFALATVFFSNPIVTRAGTELQQPESAAQA